MAGFKAKGAMAGQQIIDELRACQRHPQTRRPPGGGRRRRLRTWLSPAAQASADARRGEGGFLGIGAEQVSRPGARRHDRPDREGASWASDPV
jgi:hypothetical protein